MKVHNRRLLERTHANWCFACVFALLEMWACRHVSSTQMVCILTCIFGWCHVKAEAMIPQLFGRQTHVLLTSASVSTFLAPSSTDIHVDAAKFGKIWPCCMTS